MIECPTPAIIQAEHLYYTYGTGPLSKIALADVSLSLAAGSLAAIIGVTGSGKSTLVQQFDGLLRPSAGRLVVDGVELTAPGADLAALRKRVGMLFQFAESQLFARTVYEDVAFGPRRQRLDRATVRRRVHAALHLVGLSPHDFAHRSPFGLSGGQMRRVALAGVLAMEPHILILDEPTTGLDADARAEFYAYLADARKERGVTAILVSHDMAEVAALADHVYVLHEGRLVLQGTPRAIFASAEHLADWGLTPPPLSQLLIALRRHGLAIPPDVLTLDEAIDAVQAAHQHFPLADGRGFRRASGVTGEVQADLAEPRERAR
jgi:energy-coupling factor transport system ATP-binding protein